MSVVLILDALKWSREEQGFQCSCWKKSWVRWVIEGLSSSRIECTRRKQICKNKRGVELRTQALFLSLEKWSDNLESVFFCINFVLDISVIKKKEIMPFAATRNHLKIFILSEVSQKKEGQIYDIGYRWNHKGNDTEESICKLTVTGVGNKSGDWNWHIHSTIYTLDN